MVKIISHRGNLNGPNPNEENKFEYLLKAFQLGYIVELDLWKVNGKLYLGHDSPQYELDETIFINSKLLNNSLIHCKNSDSLKYMISLNLNLECFAHQEDDYAFTNKGTLLIHPNTKDVIKEGIIMMPERGSFTENDIKNVYALCTDYPIKYNKEVN